MRPPPPIDNSHLFRTGYGFVRKGECYTFPHRARPPSPDHGGIGYTPLYLPASLLYLAHALAHELVGGIIQSGTVTRDAARYAVEVLDIAEAEYEKRGISPLDALLVAHAYSQPETV